MILVQKLIPHPILTLKPILNLVTILTLLAVLEAKAVADAGMPAAEIRAQLEADAFEASIYLTVDSLAHLQRGGRLSQTEALLGTVLGIKPILTIQGERIEAVEKVRGMKNAYE